MLTVDGPRTDVSDVTTSSYDTAGNLTSVTNALGQVAQYSQFDGNGRPGKVFDLNGTESDLTYDGEGRLIERRLKSAAGDVVTTMAYDLEGLLTRVTLADGTWVGFEYDSGQRVAATTNNVGERVEFGYDAMGNLTGQTTKTAGGTTTKQLSQVNDELGRVRQLIGAGGQTTTLTYDVEGNVVSSSDPLSRVTGFAYDILNRQTSTTDALSGTATNEYDAQNMLSSVADQRSLPTSYVRNGFGDVIQMTSPDTGVTVYQRDKAGNATSQTDARGVVTNMTYDALNRITSRQYPATPGENVTFSYDDASSGNKGIGLLTGLTDPSGTTSYRYDDRGNRVLETHIVSGQTYATSYAYDDVGRVTSITYPSGRTVTYAYDTAGRIAGITTKDGTAMPVRPVLAGATYLPFGPLQSFTHANGVATTLGHDLDYRLTAVTAISATATIQDLAFTWNAADNITAVTDNIASARNLVFNYDALDRLKHAQGQFGTLDWTYDAVGNRLTEQYNDGSTTTSSSYAYAATSNRLSSITTGSTVRGFSYTASGNVSSDDRGAATDLTLVYNGADRLTSVTTPSSTLSVMTYDGLDRRVIRQASGATRIYHYDLADHLIATSDASGGNWVEYIWLGDLPVAQLEGGAIYAIHTDQLNQPMRMTDASAAVVWDRTQRPFGETASETGSATNALRFPGQISDPETQTAYNMARDYDPSIGRYLQSDPIGIEGGLNTYSYAGNNPVVGKDPSGRFVQRIIIGGGIGAAVDIGIQLWNNGGQWECVNWWQVGQAALIGAGLQAAIELWAARAGIAAAWSRWIQAGGGAEGGLGTGVRAGLASPTKLTTAGEQTGPEIIGPHSKWDVSGGLKGIQTDVTASEFISNLEANGFTSTVKTGTNGSVTILQNGNGSTYTVYTRSSTASSGAQYFGPNGKIIKYNLGIK